MTLRTAFAALTLALALPLSACDETGSLSSDEGATISDAQIARQNGDFDTAVRLLEGAFTANPQSAPVRTELAATLLARQDINLLDLDRIAQFIANGMGSPATTDAPAARGGTCRFATDPTARPFDPTDVEGFPAITASREEIERAIALIEPVLPAALRSFDACVAIAPDGGLVYDRAAATTQLRASGMTDAQISQLLATNALARFMSAYLFVTTDIPQQTSWYRLADGSIGVCATDEDALISQTRPAVETLGSALLSLDTRARSFGGASDIVDLATDAFADIRNALGEYCAGR